MSTMQRMTLIGMYQYDETLFDGVNLPAGYDRDTFIESLMMEHGEKCVLYSNPSFLKDAITLWSKKSFLELQRIYEALSAEYDPIYNYDRYEEYEDEEGRTFKTETNAGHKANDKQNYTDKQTNNNTDTTTNNNTDTTTNDYDVVTESNRDSITEHQISADNSSSYQPEWRETNNGGKTTTANSGTITDAHTGTITDAHTGTITRDINGTVQDLSETSNSKTNDEEKRNLKHKAHLYGNIGITSSATLVTEIVQQRFKYRLYDVACKIFADNLLIGVY